MKNIKTILFDIDDTLVDYKACEKVSLQRCYNRYFKTYTGLDTFLENFHRINGYLWQQVEEEKIPASVVGHTLFRQLANMYGCSFGLEISGFYEAELIENSFLVDGAEELLKDLKANNFKIGLISNGFANIQRTKYRNLGLSKYSEVLVIAEEIGKAKPHPQIFYHALKFMGANPANTLMVGDSLTSDGEGAKKAGLKFCWYNPHRAENSLSWQPDFIIHELKHLLDYHA